MKKEQTDFNINFISQARGLDKNLVYYVCCTKCGMMLLINHVPKRSHILSFHSKMQINSGKIQINWEKLE